MTGLLVVSAAGVTTDSLLWILAALAIGIVAQVVALTLVENTLANG